MSDIPEPNKSLVPSFPDEALLDIIYSGDGLTRAIITQRKKGGIRLRFESWMYWDYSGVEEWFWKSTDQHAHILDSIDRAKEMAESRFQNT
jgi:hypothetical protein